MSIYFNQIVCEIRIGRISTKFINLLKNLAKLENTFSKK